jgi:hypothetical protein
VVTTYEVREAEWERLRAKLTRAGAAAPGRARELLRLCLSAEQYASYTKWRHFTMTASSGQRWEIWDRGMSGNVVRLPSRGSPFYRRYCIHPPVQEFHGMSYFVTDADAHLAQALALAADERQFLHIAHLMERGMCHPFEYWKNQHGNV